MVVATLNQKHVGLSRLMRRARAIKLSTEADIADVALKKKNLRWTRPQTTSHLWLVFLLKLESRARLHMNNVTCVPVHPEPTKPSSNPLSPESANQNYQNPRTRKG